MNVAGVAVHRFGLGSRPPSRSQLARCDIDGDEDDEDNEDP